ncbi:MAG: hypothetical protein P8179_23110, partial [Candidatus Thiodiazotropha sp.]
MDVTFSAERGRYDLQEATTDASGQAVVTYFAGLNAGTDTLKARAAFAGHTEQTVTLVNPLGAQLNTRDAFIVGDEAVDGSVSYTRYDGTPIGMDYKTSAQVQMTGTGTRTATIGTLSDPNRAPILALYMNELNTRLAGDSDELGFDPGTSYQLVEDEVGLHHGTTTLNIELVNGSLLGGGKSYRFNGYSYIDIAADPQLNPAQSVGFRFDMRPLSNDASTLLDHGSGAHKVAYRANRITYSISTADGVVSVSSNPLALNQWHAVAGRYHNGNLELVVDGEVYSTSATGALAWGMSGIRIAGSYTGLLDSVKLYDWESQPLVTFDDGSLSKTLDLDTTPGMLTIQSTGQMNAQPGAALTTLRVAITTEGFDNYISLISKEGFKAIGREYMDTYNRNAPPIAYNNLGAPSASNLAANLGGQALDFFIPPAHAAFWNDWGDAWEAVKEAASWLIPYEDFVNLGKQLYYLATGDDRFNARELTFAALGVATVSPMMKPLRPLLNPVKRFITRYGNKPIIRHLGGVLGRATSEAVKGRTEKLLSLLPYLMIVAELAMDPEGLDTILMLVDSVKSADDVWTWIEYLTLPTDGWAGEAPPPVGATAYVEDTIQRSPLDFFIPVAYASTFKGKRLPIYKLKKLRKALEPLEHIIDSSEFEDLMPAVRAVVDAMKKTDMAKIRVLLHDPRTLTAAIATGGTAMRKLLRDMNSNLRISPLAMMAIITYIETRRGNCKGLVGCRPFVSKVNDKIPTLYGLAFLNALSADKDFIGRRENGAIFHLAMLALKHLTYELNEDEKQKVVSI